MEPIPLLITPVAQMQMCKQYVLFALWFFISLLSFRDTVNYYYNHNFKDYFPS